MPAPIRDRAIGIRFDIEPGRFLETPCNWVATTGGRAFFLRGIEELLQLP